MHRLKTRFAVVVLCLIGVLQTQSFGADKVFRAGASKSNITPPLGQMIVGGWAPIPAKHIHDQLYARSLVLSDGEKTVAIVMCDNVGIPREVFDAAKQQIHKQTDLPVEHLLMAATHTHSATTARGEVKTVTVEEFTEYQKFLVNRIADGVRCALNNMEPAKIGWGQVDEPSEVFNRRWHVTDPAMLTNPFGGVDQVRMNPSRGSAALLRPAGPVDPEISFVSVQSKEGRPIALLANYSLHYVGGVRSGDVSADYFGIFANLIEKRLNAGDQSPPFVGMLSNGTSGDVNNINFKEKSPRKAPYEKMFEVAEKVANRVFEEHATIEYQDWVPVRMLQTELTLKARKPTSEMLAHFDKVDASDDEAGHRREKIYSKRIRGIVAAPDEVNIPLQALQLGDLGIATIPFEVFTEIGLEIKDRSPFKTTFTIELANGSYGYLPTPEQHKLGGYETWLGTNYVEYEASNKIVKSLMEMFQKLQN